MGQYSDATVRYCSTKTNNEVQDWRRHYVCEIHTTDTFQTATAAAVAAFTLILAITGVAQWGVIRWQAKIATNQLDLTVKLSRIEHRPRLAMRDVAPTPDAIGGPVYIDFTLTNSGHGSCTIESAEFHFSTEMQGFRPSEHCAAVSDITNRKIPEAAIERIVASAEGVSWEDIESKTAGGLAGGFFFFGRMSYSDDRDIHRWIGFRRRYNPGRGRFYPEPGGDDEYQD
jgi:hypothetical protein